MPRAAIIAGSTHYPRERARALLDTLLAEDYQGVLTLEVFREADLDESLAIVASLLEERAREGPR